MTSQLKDVVEMYTDGACDPNPGVGGWAAILISPKHNHQRRELSGGEPRSTNNRMELTAAIMGLKALKRPCRVRVHTDSQYLQKAFTAGWLAKWQRNGWLTAARKPVENQDLWRALLELAAIHQIEWRWVMGHASDPLNERCDELAVQARRKVASEQRRSNGEDYSTGLSHTRRPYRLR